MVLVLSGRAAQLIRPCTHGKASVKRRLQRVYAEEPNNENASNKEDERIVDDSAEPEKPMVSNEMRERLKEEYVSFGGAPNRPLRNNPFLLIIVVISAIGTPIHSLSFFHAIQPSSNAFLPLLLTHVALPCALIMQWLLQSCRASSKRYIARTLRGSLSLFNHLSLIVVNATP